MPRKTKPKAKKEVLATEHKGVKRTNNPPAGLVNEGTDEDLGQQTTKYEHDPHIDPMLSWAGKAEKTTLEIPLLSLHRHEHIAPPVIWDTVRGDANQNDLFVEEREWPYSKAVEFYQHEHGWSNRMIAGDSLYVLNSLLQKENMAGKVQTVFMDPPFGITYKSNFQPFVNKNEVKENDLTHEPETIRAFRDTWEMGIHSYLNHLRDRLLLIRTLLTNQGSCFIQIGKENVHRVALVLDELFGSVNHVSTITLKTSGFSSASKLPQVSQYILWYAKDIEQCKYRQLYEPLTRKEKVGLFAFSAMVEEKDGTCRALTKDEKNNPDILPEGSRLVHSNSLASQGTSTTGRSDPYEWQGNVYPCPQKKQWSVSKEGLDSLAKQERLVGVGKHLYWKKYEDEVPGRTITNFWDRRKRADKKRYVVQTNDNVIERCLLMSSDPGDLVLDPTCGSGVTAYNSEKWGRRWITCDSSRVALAIAKKRLTTAHFDYFKLNSEDEGITSGFEYETYKKVSAGTLAYEEPIDHIKIFDSPKIDESKIRVTGNFTVEAVPAPTVKSLTPPLAETIENIDSQQDAINETTRQESWRSQLEKSGIRGKNNQKIMFSRIETAAYKWIHAEGETIENLDHQIGENMQKGSGPQQVCISFGPDHGPLDQRQVEKAVKEAIKIIPNPDILVFAAFQFDTEAINEIDAIQVKGGMTILKAHMNSDLHTDDLKKSRPIDDSFWLLGQPDVTIEKVSNENSKDKAKWVVTVNGFDYFDSDKLKLTSGGKNDIAMWMLDTNYDGRCLFPSQVFFPLEGKEDDLYHLSKALRAEIDLERFQKYKGTESIPFIAGNENRVAIKIIDIRGVESMVVKDLDDDK